MDNGNASFYDLTVLLKWDGINLREIAEEFVRPAEEYFMLLSEFLVRAADVMAALEAFAKRDGDIKMYRRLDEMATLLKEMKCPLFIADFYSVLGAYDQGNWKLAAFGADKTAPAFYDFMQKIALARKPKTPDGAPDATLSLKEYIGRLDEAEANRKMVILAVDDSPSILTSLSFILSKEYKVFTLLKPTELEKVLKKLTPDLFLLDYEMPVLNGFELVPVIRNFKEHRDTPIIYLTSIGTKDTVVSALALGACDFVVKPFNADKLLEKIGKWIVRKKSF